jgi:ABC-type sugar transport system ATPase subunit
MATLRLEGIEKVFPGGQKAVTGVDLEVSAGELVVLLGPSGCGKSTLLRIVAGVETPSAGRVFVDGTDITDFPPQKRDVAMVFQSYALYPHMTVRENLGFGLRMRGTPAPELKARVSEVAESLGLAPFLERKPFQLSGGQRQRVALGRAIARRAKVFLLDEPLSNLDAQLRVSTRAELARLHRVLPAPMLYVTHDQEEAMTLGDRVVVMSAGRILQVAKPMEVYERPATRFVASFVGSPRMNFLPAALAGPLAGGLPAGGSAVAAGGSAVVAGGNVVVAGGNVVVGVRPEDLLLAAPGDGDLAARIDLVEPLGRESLVHLVLEPAWEDGPLSILALAPGGFQAEAGERVGLRVRPGKAHYFDARSEERIACVRVRARTR